MSGSKWAGIDPNPARDRRIRLPYEEHVEINPPTAAHVEAVYRTLPPAFRLALLWLDWSGARVASVTCSPRRLRRTRPARPPAGVDDEDAAGALGRPARPARRRSRGVPARESDRDGDARLFPGVTADRLRTAIARACRANGVPVFSPHDLRHRRISLLHPQGRSWAEIARFVGQRKLSVTADTYTHVLMDGRRARLRVACSGRHTVMTYSAEEACGLITERYRSVQCSARPLTFHSEAGSTSSMRLARQHRTSPTVALCVSVITRGRTSASLADSATTTGVGAARRMEVSFVDCSVVR